MTIYDCPAMTWSEFLNIPNGETVFNHGASECVALANQYNEGVLGPIGLTGATGPSYRPTKEAFVLVCTVPSQTATNTWAFRPVVGSYLESNAEL